MSSNSGPAADCSPALIAGRYRVQEVLGRGGMALVYRVTDQTTGRDLALKQIVPQPEPKQQREATLLFEREFHTLAQLAHPRVTEVYDYGLDAGVAYYTMELLEGGDLRERSPLPWREACALLVDVCSSLALLHSRRLVHRDVSPRNIQFTRDGFAKLIDFGALAPMGPNGRVVGTPPFVAPEVVHRLTLDARTDLFSLGTTLYYALTGRFAYPARHFRELHNAWRTKPNPPSSLIAGIPAALDALIMSLISLDPAMRPRTAYDVMQMLAALAGVDRAEPVSVAQAYLSTPVMVGRSAPLKTVREQMASALRQRGSGVLIGYDAGGGRSRILDECVLEAKTLGATVLRASAGSADSADFALARTLVEQLLEMLPVEAMISARGGIDVLPTLFVAAPATEVARDSSAAERAQLKPVAELAAQPAATQAALNAWLIDVAMRNFVVIAVDDVQRIDAPSAALLGALAYHAERARLFLALTIEGRPRADAIPALRVIAEHCTPLELQPLSGEETQELLKSVFGEVPNVDLVSARIHQVARGNPRECMDLAQHLCDTGRIVYDGGIWSLPSELDAAELPGSGEQILRERVATLQPLSRWIAQTQALASHDTFTLEDYALLDPDATPQAIDNAISELVSHQVLVGNERMYTLARANCAQALSENLGSAELEQRHRSLAKMYEGKAERELPAMYHLLLGGQHEQALDRIGTFLQGREQTGLQNIAQMSPRKIAAMVELAVDVATPLPRPQRDIYELQRWLILVSVVTSDRCYYRARRPFLSRLEADSGLAAWRNLADVADPGERLKLAIERTIAQHSATPEAERVYRVDEAIRFLVQYVVISIAIGARAQDSELVASLPELLAPFAPVSPLVEAMWQNAIATFESNFGAREERSLERVAELHTRLTKFTEAEFPYVGIIRNALAYAAGVLESTLGLLSAPRWADILDADPLQRVNAMHLRKMVCLQQGDAEGAERFRKEAEILAAQANTPQMFSRAYRVELKAYAAVRDLTGVKQIIDGVAELAETGATWIPVRLLAEGHFERIRGDLAAALSAYEECLALCTPDASDPARAIATWPTAVAGSVEVLTELGRAHEARTRGEAALLLGEQTGLDVALLDIARALALAEAKLNDYERATARLSAVIARQLDLGVTGLNLGASYEARTRIAIWADDRTAVEKYAELTARQYRHGQGSALGTLYERLMAEARSAGVALLPQLSEFAPTMATKAGFRTVSAPKVLHELSSAQNAVERAARALRLIARARGAGDGYLFLLTDHGLTLASSTVEAAPTADLVDRIDEHLKRELDRSDTATLIVTASNAIISQRTAFWTDSSGIGYEPLLLICTVEGVRQCAGVALLPSKDAHAGGADAIEVLDEVSALLIAAGDARGVLV